MGFNSGFKGLKAKIQSLNVVQGEKNAACPESCTKHKQDRQYTYNVTFRRVCANIVAMEKQ